MPPTLPSLKEHDAKLCVWDRFPTVFDVTVKSGSIFLPIYKSITCPALPAIPGPLPKSH